jgi:ATP-dependent RNA helicase DDX51/DBP6
MFGVRYDPNAVNVVNKKQISIDKILSRKRRISLASISSNDDEHDDKKELQSQHGSEIDEKNEQEVESSSDSDSDSDSEKKNTNVLKLNSIEDGLEEEEESSSYDEENTHSGKSDLIEDGIESDMENESVQNDEKYLSKHESIFKRLQKVARRQESKDADGDEILEAEDEEAEIEKRDLQPLPQPSLPRDKRLISNSTHLKNLDWLASPIYALPQDTKSFSDFKLSSFMIKNLQSQGFENAFSVQIAVLDMMLQDAAKNELRPDIMGDILVNASTGSGKTLAYSIPIIESLHSRVVPRVRAIILVPTKPLINQVRATFLQLSKGTNLTIMSLKSDISIKEEGEKLSNNPPDIIVSTPGRLVDHINNLSIDLKSLRYLVIDEADRLLNQSFQNWANVLIGKLQSPVNIASSWRVPVQKLIFSATLTTDSGKLSRLNFQNPRLIIVNQEKKLVNELFNVPLTLSEFKIHLGTAKSSLKPLILTKFLISNNKLNNVLIFTKSNESSLRLSRLLQLLMEKLSPKTTVTYINSTNNKSQVRNKILKQFSDQEISIVVATDLIARGIDILSITDVINYDLPNSSREYVHRVGRTARANQSGYAYNFCFGKGELKWFNTIMKDVGRSDKTIENLDLDVKSMITNEDEQLYRDSLSCLQKQMAKK